MQTLRILVLAILNFVSPGAAKVAEPAVVDAIVAAGQDATREEVSLLTVYAWFESNASSHPRAYSWDAKAGKSCGAWQEPCSFAKTASALEQARYWLRELRASGLASVDSSPARAAKRQALAEAALASVP